MGEIADSLINGEFDYISGEYLGKPIGYPRTKSNKKKHKPNPPKPNYSIVYELITEDKASKVFSISHDQISEIVLDYAHTVLNLPKEVKESTVHKHIKRTKVKFVTWLREKYPNL